MFNDDVDFYPSAIEELCKKENGIIWVGPTSDEKGQLSYGGIRKISTWRPKTEITGTDRVTGLHTDTDFFGVQAVFMFRATDPLNSFLPELQIRGRSVYVDDQAQTNVEGVFAGGDCTGQPWQVNRAAGQGQKAALSAIRYLAKRDEEIGY